MSDPVREAFEKWWNDAFLTCGESVEPRYRRAKVAHNAWLAALDATLPPEICPEGHPLACLKETPFPEWGGGGPGQVNYSCSVCEARDKALEEVETIAELYHNPVAQAIVKEIRRLREKKA